MKLTRSPFPPPPDLTPGAIDHPLAYECNASVVSAGGVDLGYELLQRRVGARKWERVSTTQDSTKAQKWAARSGYTIRKLRGF